MRILISAYYCSPYRGGESAVGWQVATELANHHDVTVVCGCPPAWKSSTSN